MWLDTLRSRSGRWAIAGLTAVVAVGLALAVAGLSRGAPPSTARAGDADAQGQVLVQHYFTLLHDGDVGGLDTLLTPGFQAVRANGDVQDKASYLADPPQIEAFTIASLHGTKAGDVLVVSYRLTVTETIGGVEQTTGPAPRLSVFQWRQGAWRLAAHANFGALQPPGVVGGA